MFSALTGSSAAGSLSRQPAGSLSAACGVRVGAKDDLPNFPKKRATKWGTTRSFSRGFFPEEDSRELLAIFPSPMTRAA